VVAWSVDESARLHGRGASLARAELPAVAATTATVATRVELVGEQPGVDDELDELTPTEPPVERGLRPHSLARDLVALTKPRITTTVVATMLAGAWVAARYRPDPGSLPTRIEGPSLLGAVLGTALVVSGANALNMYLERGSDGLMARTARRPLPQGRMSPRLALVFGLVLGLGSLPLLALAANTLTAALAALALVSYVAVYTPMKRVSTWSLPVGAIPGAVPPLLGWTAVRGTLDLAGLALFGVLFVWQLPHFHAIGLFRRREYARAGLKTLAGELGEGRARLHIALELFVVVALSLALVPLGVAGVKYLVAASVLGVVLLAVGLRPLAPVERWGRALFGTSVLYLVLLMLALVVG
jgi:protoheme IX farnesyltransferase